VPSVLEKIVLCLPLGLSNGGVTTWTISLAKRLRDSGLNTEILSHTNPYPSGFAEPKGAKIKHISGKDAWTASSMEIINFLPEYSLSTQGATVIAPNFSWGAFASAALTTICNSREVRILGICHSDEEHYYELLSYYEPVIGKFIGVSSEIVNRLKAMLPHRSADIIQLVYPVEAATTPRDTHRGTDRPLVITYAGRIQNGQKRIRDVKPLCVELARSTGKYHFQFAGEGPERRHLEKFFSQSGFSNISAEFLGLVPFSEMPTLWRGSDVAILFSEFEGTSISMLEAMAQGSCPVVTNVSGVEEVIQDGVNGFVCEIGDTQKMALVLNNLFASRETLYIVSEKARLSIISRGTFESYDREFVEIARQCSQSNVSLWPSYKNVFPITEGNAISSLDSYSTKYILRSLSKRIIRRISHLPWF
jgi:glycosyltransferase involved in cell wall biosynthesis